MKTAITIIDFSNFLQSQQQRICQIEVKIIWATGEPTTCALRYTAHVPGRDRYVNRMRNVGGVSSIDSIQVSPM